MQKLTREQYRETGLLRLVRSVTFFKDIVRIDEDQFDLLLSVSDFLTSKAGEVVLKKGEVGQTLYFLLRGQLNVMCNDSNKCLNIINPGEVVGTLSMVTGSERSATVVAENDVTLLGMDFKHFNDVNDYSLFKLDTKLVAYRMVVHNIRWTLELNKMQNPQHPLAGRLHKMPIYTGTKGGKEELSALHEQARLLANLLCEWNETLQPEALDVLSA